MRFLKPNIKRLTAKRDTPKLIAVALSDRDSTIRQKAAEALGHLRDPAAIDSLCALMESSAQKNYFTRLEAIKVLGQIGGEKALEALSKEAWNENGQSAAATRALANLPGEVPVEALAVALRRGERMARRLALEKLLTCINSDQLDLLEPALFDSEPSTKVSAALFFLHQGDLRGLAPLVNLLEAPPRDNGDQLEAHTSAKDTLLEFMASRPKNVPLELLHKLSDLPDIHEDVSYYLEFDPLYDVGHDTVTQEYADVRAAARQALKECSCTR
jgi:HEAT repeat protein